MEGNAELTERPGNELSKPIDSPVRLEPRELTVELKEGTIDKMLGTEEGTRVKPADIAGKLNILAGNEINSELIESITVEKALYGIE